MFIHRYSMQFSPYSYYLSEGTFNTTHPRVKMKVDVSKVFCLYLLCSLYLEPKNVFTQDDDEQEGERETERKNIHEN